jgi:hypothetical protein
MDEFRSRDVEVLLKRASKFSFPNEEESFGGYKFSDDYKQRMYALGEKYKNLIWLPLDIPRIEFDDYNEFLDIWNYQSHDVVRVKSDIAEPWTKEGHPWKEKSSWNVAQFNGLHLYQHPNVPIDGNSFAAKLYTGKIPMFERIVDQVNTYYPVHTLISLFIWESKMPIAAHRDRGAFWNCPTDFRSMLYDENTEPTLYVSDNDLKPVYVDLPEDTNTFCWSNGKSLHGSTYYGKRKFILCASMIQHSKKTEELVDRSIIKYKDKLNYKLDA